MLTFPFPVKADLNDEMSLPSIVLSYGDGNKQRSPDGLNLPKTIWNIQCPVDNKARSATLQSFLISVGNHTPFLWQSPRDTKPEFYYITGKIGGTYRLGGGKKPDFFVRTMQFEYANVVAVIAPAPTPTPTPTPARSFIYVSDGDINGLIYYLGVNPVTGMFEQSVGMGTASYIESSANHPNAPATLVQDRQPQSSFISQDIPNSWFAIKFNGNVTISINKYSLQSHGSENNRHLRNWILEGTNTVSIFDIAGVNAATWTAIDTRVNDLTIVGLLQYYTLTPNGSATAFKFLRFRQTGGNSSGNNHLSLNEIEVYGVVTL